MAPEYSLPASQQKRPKRALRWTVLAGLLVALAGAAAAPTQALEVGTDDLDKLLEETAPEEEPQSPEEMQTTVYDENETEPTDPDNNETMETTGEGTVDLELCLNIAFLVELETRAEAGELDINATIATIDEFMLRFEAAMMADVDAAADADLSVMSEAEIEAAIQAEVDARLAAALVADVESADIDADLRASLIAGLRTEIEIHVRLFVAAMAEGVVSAEVLLEILIDCPSLLIPDEEDDGDGESGETTSGTSTMRPTAQVPVFPSMGAAALALAGLAGAAFVVLRRRA